MIRVTVELVSFGEEDRKKTIGTLEIANDGTGDSVTGNYTVRAYDERDEWVRTKVKGHKRQLGFWVLLRLALQQLGY